eukprot:jgi/Botrbrau1/13600/Bobra.0307s0019.1
MVVRQDCYSGDFWHWRLSNLPTLCSCGWRPCNLSLFSFVIVFPIHKDFPSCFKHLPTLFTTPSLRSNHSSLAFSNSRAVPMPVSPP